jgi:hypothetical protein
MTSFSEANDLIESGGISPAKFETVGAAITGTVVDAEVQQQREINTGKPKFWDDGTPRRQIVAYVDTAQRDPQIPDDNGRRALYIRGNMLKALRTALRLADAQLAEGGILTVTYTGDGERTKTGFNPPKEYKVTYAPPADPGVTAANEVLGTPPQPAAAGPAAPAAGSRPPSIPAETWDSLNDDQKRALLAVTPAY